jgi:hypothetical protein
MINDRLRQTLANAKVNIVILENLHINSALDIVNEIDNKLDELNVIRIDLIKSLAFLESMKKYNQNELIFILLQPVSIVSQIVGFIILFILNAKIFF